MKVRLQSHVFTLVLCLTLASDVPFFFDEQPKDAELNEGDEAKLYCIVSPIPPGVRYTWYRSTEFKGEDSVIEDKLEPLVGVEASIWYQNEVSRDATGYYHCKVETDDYKLFSNTAFVRVKYFTKPEVPVTQNRQLSNHQGMEYLPCSTPESSPIMDITWTKNDKPISNPRMFVFPEDMINNKGTLVTRGTLLIVNVIQGDDDATYKCLTKEAVQIDGGEAQQIPLSIYQVSTTSGANPINRTPISVFRSYASSDGNIQIVSGGEVTLVCAGEGYPTPNYEWYEESDDGSEVQIRGSDSLLLEDNNRRLVASNIVHPKTYICKMVNTFSGRVNKRPNYFYITTIGDSSDYNIDIVKKPTPSYVLKPNRYTPFTLECSVRKTGQIQILWLKDGEKMVWNARITTDDKETTGADGQVATSRNLIFETTNESDLGVYQCVIFNSERLKVETAYVTLEKDSLPYELNTRDPQYEFLRGPYSVDEGEEECNKRDGHLVSILDENENSRVHELVKEYNTSSNKVESVWIGLTREVPEPEGYWLWTQSGDISTSYSNWHDDKPDNKYGYQEYTVMSASNGKWADVDKDTKRPAVCKRYHVVCPSVDEFYDGRVRVRGWESVGATYEVGQQVEVSCRFPGEKMLSITHVTCGDDKQFAPATLEECPEVPSSSPYHSLNHPLLTAALLRYILSTYGL